jgi:glycosyltransferase involved in cell wall biosynthesis
MTVRILNLIPTLGKGGAERQLSLLAPTLVREGQAIAVAFHKGGPNLKALEGAGVSLFRLPPRSNYDPRLLLDIFSIVQNFRPNIIQTWLPQMDVLGGLVANWTGIKHIICERSSSVAYSDENWKLKLRIKLGKKAIAIVANSEIGIHYWKNICGKSEMKIIRNGLSPISIIEPIDSLGLKNHRLILAASRLSYEKNIGILVESLENTLKILPDHHAVIFGDGPEKSKNETIIKKSKVADRIHFGGYTESLYWWFQNSECFISTSLFEGNPNVVLEGAASGCPLVVSDIPAHREFLDNDSALFSIPHNSHGFTQALLETILNPDASAERARRAKLIADELTISAAALEYTELYAKITNKLL